MGREGRGLCVSGEMVKAGEGFYTPCPRKLKIQDRYFHFFWEGLLADAIRFHQFTRPARCRMLLPQFGLPSERFAISAGLEPCGGWTGGGPATVIQAQRGRCGDGGGGYGGGAPGD